MTHTHDGRGFTLIETLIATGLIVTAVAGLAKLFTLSARFTRDAGQFGVALVAAQDKLESLRALPFGYDETGEAVTDPGLHASPDGTLTGDVDRYVDWIDEGGSIVGGASGDAGAGYVRRWRISAVAVDDPAAIAIDVCVYRLPGINADPAQADACLATIRVRQP
jgi:type II secretory pathway pseudopilin PulG